MRLASSSGRSFLPARRIFGLLIFGLCFAVDHFTVPAARADEAGDWAALIQLRQQIGENTFKNKPEVAVAALQKFQKGRQLDPVLMGEVTLQIAQIQRTQLNQPNQAMQMLQVGWQAAIAKPDPAKPVAVMYLEEQAAALLDAKKPAEAQKLLESNLPIIELAAKSGHAHMEQFASQSLQRLVIAQRDLRPEGTKPTDTIALLQKSLLTLPVFLNPERQKSISWQEGWMYEELMLALSQAGQSDQALRWGRLYFAEAAYDKSAIERATQALGTVWAGQNDLVKIRAFIQAQSGISQETNSNPLDGVSLPALKGEAGLVAALNGLRDLQKKGAWRGRVVPIISLHIARGDFGAAMTEAQGLFTSNANAADGPQQIARVFKAKDGDIQRANAFLSYLDGKAPNPMPGFMAEVTGAGQPAFLAQGQPK